jgi:hypothetical protein
MPGIGQQTLKTVTTGTRRATILFKTTALFSKTPACLTSTCRPLSATATHTVALCTSNPTKFCADHSAQPSYRYQLELVGAALSPGADSVSF